MQEPLFEIPEEVLKEDYIETNTEKKGIRSWIADSTAVTAVLFPVSSFIDTYFAGVSDWDSVKTRLAVMGITFAGLGKILPKIGDWTRKWTNVQPKPDTDTYRHDSFMLGLSSFAACFPIYLACGVTNMKEIFEGALITACSAPAILATIDLFRGSFGLKTKYVFDSLMGMNSTAKKGLAGLILATSIVSTTAVYTFNSDTTSLQPIKQEIRETYNSAKKSLEDYIIK